MNASACSRLDDYLDGGLSAGEREEFVAHLPDCEPCRRAVEEQEHLNRLLARATTEHWPVPAGLLDRVERRARSSWRRRVAWAAGVGVAAAIGCGVVWLAVSPRRPVVDSPAPSLVEAPRPPTPTAAPPPQARVTFGSPDDVIAVPMRSANPAVTIIWVYPVANVPSQAAETPASIPEDLERSEI
jgi:anti-sigma factor RsiW